MSHLFVSIEGNIGSGKSTVCTELAKLNPDVFVAEKQRVEEWTYLSDFYAKQREDYAVLSQSQIYQSFHRQWGEYQHLRFDTCANPCFKNLVIRKSPNAYVKVTCNDTGHYRAPIDDVHIHNLKYQVSPSQRYSKVLLMEGILSSHGVFTSVNHELGSITTDQFTRLETEWNNTNANYNPSVVFWLKPKSLECCNERIKHRARSFESDIDKQYLKSLDDAYTRLFHETTPYKVVEINNEELSPMDTAMIIASVLNV